ncbi:hypothetical protein BDZ94DRAFT_1300877 [Collybia nuda]|uniref:Uncharacterized protein n=1 Tax=Collybia nuda TaxID=64659 RepID=A0A9P5XY49_9AGAR|nr:hypothetical protein BDZ94DRAFT_1300877 [Collybia nuda]
MGVGRPASTVVRGNTDDKWAQDSSRTRDAGSILLPPKTKKKGVRASLSLPAGETSNSDFTQAQFPIPNPKPNPKPESESGRSGSGRGFGRLVTRRHPLCDMRHAACSVYVHHTPRPYHITAEAPTPLAKSTVRGKGGGVESYKLHTLSSSRPNPDRGKIAHKQITPAPPAFKLSLNSTSPPANLNPLNKRTFVGTDVQIPNPKFTIRSWFLGISPPSIQTPVHPITTSQHHTLFISFAEKARRRLLVLMPVPAKRTAHKCAYVYVYVYDIIAFGFHAAWCMVHGRSNIESREKREAGCPYEWHRGSDRTTSKDR